MSARETAGSPHASFSFERRLRIAATDLWELMWRPSGQRRWLGPESRIAVGSPGRSVLVDEVGAWRFAHDVVARGEHRLSMQIDPLEAWGTLSPTTATIRIEPDGERASVVHVEERDVPAEHAHEVERYWRGRVARLQELVSTLARRRRNTRQAIVVIHGIGEQQPGETLANLAASGVLTSGENQDLWVKPDRVSGSYELRRLTIGGTAEQPTTDVFELYWAHVIRDTTLGQVAAWLRRLLCRRRVPRPLRGLWVAAWLAVLGVGAALAATLFGVQPARWLAAGSALALGLGFLWRYLATPLAVDVLGDAARYLMPSPANVAHRQAIREAGVDLLRELHQSGDYDRIVILGHSLGSVIAYDIVTHAWIGMHGTHLSPSRPSFKEVVRVDRSIAGLDPVDSPVDPQVIQNAAWRRTRANTQPWLVTDLVTAGSPLTYADFLMFADRDAFAAARKNRVLPCCPPQTEYEAESGLRRTTFEVPYRDRITRRKRTFTCFHHGAPFAVTRWTNLYFEVSRLGLSGDLIGGPLAPLFGEWVRDVPLRAPKHGFAHCWYWKAVAGDESDRHLRTLREALRLESRFELRDLMREIPAAAL